MQYSWNLLRATFHCSYKAWLLFKESSEENQQEKFDEGRLILPIRKISPLDKLILAALYLQKDPTQEIAEILYKAPGGKTFQASAVRLSKYYGKAQQLLNSLQDITGRSEPPAFYRNPHCPECQFKDSCYEKLKQRDCISILAGMSPKVVSKYQKKGITSITQLSHLFRPRRRRGRSYKTSTFLWELKALALREQKTFVLHPPDLPESSKIIYLDFEGVPEENWVYLLGGVIKQEGKSGETFSFWANNKRDEKEIFRKLFELFHEHPEAQIYHYGSYETKALKKIAKKWGGIFKKELPQIENRMVNLVGYLRTHVYPPTYSNGLKELAGFLGFQWQEETAGGLRSIEWRNSWEEKKEEAWKEKLLQYNQDDCRALEKVEQWFRQLTSNSEQENVMQVSKMKRQSPFKFQDNPHYGEDYIYISRAAYFDYQRKKIYWRGNGKALPILNFRKLGPPALTKKGVAKWKPKKVNEIVIAPPLKKCPHCGHGKVYHVKKERRFRQTDLKFTLSGIKQWVVEYHAASVKCAQCNMKSNDRILRMLLYGDNLFAWAINLYVKYHISHDMISRMLREQFGIWMNPIYLIQRKHKWCKQWKPEVEYIRKIIMNSPVIHIDETSVRLSKDKGYVWTFATPHTVFYHYSSSHEGDFLKDWLKGYKGTIVTDFFPVYEVLPVKRQKCLIHLIRDLNDDLYKNPFDEEYKEMVTAFGKMLRNIIGTVDRYGLKKVHLQKHLKDTVAFFKEFLEPSHKSELAVKYSKRLKKHWEHLWTFLHHDNIPWNNNNAETAIKAFAQYRRGVNGQVSERGIQEYLEMLSIAQTCRYRNISFLSFLRRKAGIWENVNPEALPGFLPFNQARLYIQRLGFQRKQEWNQWEKAGKRPAFIPSSPERVYCEKGWMDWHNWIGFSFLPFNQARRFMRRLRLKNRDEYWAWLRSGKRPKVIPYSPEIIYRHAGWEDLGDWLGTGNTGQQKKPRMTYEQAKKYIQAVGIKTQHEFFQWRKTKERPATIPPDPNRAYHEFESWGKFLGTDRVANQDKKYWGYEKAKAFLKLLGIRTMKNYKKLYDLGAISKQIPKRCEAYYKKQGTWVSSSDFLGKSQ